MALIDELYEILFGTQATVYSKRIHYVVAMRFRLEDWTD